MMRRIEQFQAARWAEPLIMQLGTPGERGIVPPAPDDADRARPPARPTARIPAALRRKAPPRLPEASQQTRAAPLHAPVADDHGRRRDAGHDGHLHHEIQPEGQRPHRPPAADGRPPPAAGRIHHPGPAGDPLPHEPHHVRDRRHGRVQLPARQRRPGHLHERLHHPRLSRRRAASSTAPRDHHHRLLAPGRCRHARGRRLQGHHALSPASMATPSSTPSRRRSPSARPASCSPARRTPASSIRSCASSSTSCTGPAASPPTTRPTATACSASSAPATPASTCASSTCTRPSRPRTAASASAAPPSA